MPEIKEPQRGDEPVEDSPERKADDADEFPGHTPGVAEGDDDEAPAREHPYPDPDHTPGSAEG